ncbi:hypothetical protein [Arthrobacter sp. NPDC090010]|uniref:hypothetical protein n=1 Tax=Arthrobacter sp. NPDC090010 TaxID=3363942 RepID=UPI00380AF77D
MKKKSIATTVATLALLLAAPMIPAHAGTTPGYDSAQGRTICGAYQDGGTGYGYNFEKNIPISSAGWGRLLANDPYGIKVGDNIWAKIHPTLGKTFPLSNWSGTKMITEIDPRFGPRQVPAFTNLDTAMNNATCGSTFYVGPPKALQVKPTDPIPPAGHMKVIQVRTNGISFVGTDGVMKGAVMNFRIMSGASKTFLNVHTTGPKLDPGLQDAARWTMEMLAGTTWDDFASRIGAAQ